MALQKIIRWLIYGVAGLFGLILVLLMLLAVVRIPIDLTGQKKVVESFATKAIGRQVMIDKKIQVSTSLWPVFTLEGLRIGNPKEFPNGDFAKMESARLQVGIIPLLLAKAHVEDFSVEGLQLNLRVNEAGSVNWTFGQPTSKAAKSLEEPKTGDQLVQTKIVSDSLVVKKIDLRKVSVSYHRPDSAEPFEFIIKQCTGSALAGQPFHLGMEGTLQEEIFTTLINAGSLQELLEHNRSWMEIETKIANAQLTLSGNVDLAKLHQSLQLSAAIEGERLESFNRLLQLDLPPMPSYGVKAKLAWQQDRVELSDFNIHIGSSSLLGKMSITTAGTIPKAEIDLRAPLVQINDFSFPEWSAAAKSIQASEPMETADVGQDQAKAKEKASTSPGGDSQISESASKILSPEFLGSFDAHLLVSAEKVQSGEDQLGSGRLVAKLEKGRITIDPLELNVPGGSFTFATSVKPGLVKTEASVRTKIENFDFGVIARRVDPQTDMGGTINLDVNLESSVRNFSEILANGNGHFDFSAQPKNLRAGILDLWAVNLVTAVVARSDKDQSQIECLIGRWSMKDGFLKPDAFVIDTSRMRICGTGWVDFRKEEVDLKVAPIPKRPEFFSLATPLGVHGKFSDFEVGVVSGGMVGTAFKFISSPIHVPIRRLAGRTLPEDASDICAMTLGPDNRPKSPPAGCAKFFQKKDR